MMKIVQSFIGGLLLLLTLATPSWAQFSGVGAWQGVSGGSSSATNVVCTACISLTTEVSGILPTANGGTNIAYFTVAGPTVARVYTFPDAAATVLTTNATVTAAQGGTGIANGASSTLTLPNAATTISTGGTIALGGFTLTVPATGTDAMLGVANVFTANQTVSSTAPSLILTDTTASAKSLTIAVDANLAQIRESAGASGSLMVLDLTNSRVGIITTTPRYTFDINGQLFVGASLKTSSGVDILNLSSSEAIGSGFRLTFNRSVNGAGAYYMIQSVEDGVGYRTISLNPDGGGVSIGKSANTTLLDILGANNTTVQTITINATQANITAADVFMDFRSTTGSEATIAGTAVAGVIAYNTFTGSHYTQIDDRNGLEVGMLLEATGEKLGSYAERRRPSKNDGDPEEVFQASDKPHLVKSRISRTKGSQSAYGVYGGTDKEGRDMVFALGSGPCRVAKTNKNVTIGDYLIASDVPGAMEIQADGVYRNSTVAKAMEPVTWAQGEVVRSGVACIYLGG